MTSRGILEPYTLEHWKRWTSELVLDSAKSWKVEPFQVAFAEDFLAGTPQCWLVIPEGNGKTTLVANLALYHCQFKRWASISAAASSRDQAQNLWDAAEGLIIRSDSLEGVFKVHPGKRQIRCAEAGSKIQIWAADSRTGDGIIPTLCIVDELHRHRDLRLYRTWTGKLLKRHGQIITISTAGEPGSEFEEQRELIRQTAKDLTRHGAFVRAADRDIVLHEYAVPEDGDVNDLHVVKAANPLKVITLTSLKQKRAWKTMTEAHWRRFTCNLPTRSERAAITESEWFEAESTEEIPEGEPIWAGLDVAWKWDTTALVPLWIRDPEFRLLGPATVLVPPRDGSSLDPNLVEDALITLHRRNPIHTLVMDITRAEQLAEWAKAELGCEVVERGQSNTFAALDYESFMEALRHGWLHHQGGEFTRHALNAVARLLPGGGARFDRPSQVRKGGEQDLRVIDALVAAAMVHTAASAELGGTAEPMVAWGG